LFDNYYWCITNEIFGKCLTVAKRERKLIDTINFAILPEMRERLNSFNRDRCGGFAKPSDIGRHLFDVALTYYGYPSPQAQQMRQPTPAPMQSPFQPPPMAMTGTYGNGR
jgi:hypothetical protein